MFLTNFLISKGLPSIVRDVHELFVFFMIKAFPSIVRDFLISKGIPSIATDFIT